MSNLKINIGDVVEVVEKGLDSTSLRGIVLGVQNKTRVYLAYPDDIVSENVNEKFDCAWRVKLENDNIVVLHSKSFALLEKKAYKERELSIKDIVLNGEEVKIDKYLSLGWYKCFKNNNVILLHETEFF